ncbi:MAG: HEAT repeat domain-containing protein [Verrucomicrobiota bacterium]|nr:HEAT repeat domain-containing protein [Verrucomicrobiota bacterium]
MELIDLIFIDKSTLLFYLIVFFCPFFICAQSENPNAPTPKETEIKTISKCINDYHTGNEKQRKRAILVLGKYNNSSAVQTIINALDDHSALIRQSALVSLSEKPNIPERAKEKIVSLFIDTDIHIQRISTSLITRIARMSRIKLMRAGSKNRFFHFDQKHRDILNKCLVSGDYTVRKNIILHAHYFYKLLDKNILIDCLDTTEDELRLLIIQKCKYIIGKQKLLDYLEKNISSEKSSAILLEYIKLLSSYKGKNNTEVFLKWCNYPDSKVRYEAIKGIILSGSQKAIPFIEKYVLGNNPLQEKLNLIRYSAYLHSVAIKMLERLLENDNLAIKNEVLQKLVQLKGPSNCKDMLIELLKSEISKIRKTAMRYLRNCRNIDWEKIIPEISQSQYPDIRYFSIENIHKLHKGRQTELLLNLLIDDNVDVKTYALRTILSKKIDNWQQILKQSIMSADIDMQKTAMPYIRYMPKNEQLEIYRYLDPVRKDF